MPLRWSIALAGFVAAAAAVLPAATTDGQEASPLGGVWTLSRSLSEWPPEIGFDVNWVSAPGGDNRSAAASGGRERRGSPETYEDARRVQLLTGEARNPPARLMVVDTTSTITITNELGQSRTLHPDGREESIAFEGVSIPATTRREGDRLVVAYRVAAGREVRYTYSRLPDPARLVVEVQFLERGAGDKARRVYEPGVAAGTPASSPAAPTPSPAGHGAPASFDARPGAELRGLRSLGILVEDLSTQAVACGLNHGAIEAALSKRLADGGLTVRGDSDDDTYVYVNVMTTTASNGVCVSRFDAFLYTHATASLSYREQPVLVQVSLMHRGSIGVSAPAGHAAAVVRGLENYIDLFVTAIRDANK